MSLAVNVTEVPLHGALEVVSLAWGANGKLYGGTTGAKGGLLFEYDPATIEFADLGGLVVSGTQLLNSRGKRVEQKIHKGLAVGPDGRIWGVTGQNVGVGVAHWRLLDDEGGHIFVHDPTTGACQDIGIPVPNQWIINCALDPEGRNLYGMTYPLNYVFRYDIAADRMQGIDQLHGGTYGDSGCSHEIICDLRGRLYGSCSDGYLFTYDPQQDRLTETRVELPGGDVRIDSLARDAGGLIYGGTWESGHLFRFDPETFEMTDLGQPGGGPRLPALGVGADGMLYGAAGGGAQYGTREAFLFRYDPSSGALEELGDIYCAERDIRGQRMHAMAIGDDGDIYLGETGSDQVIPSDAPDGYLEAAIHPYLFRCTVS